MTSPERARGLRWQRDVKNYMIEKDMVPYAPRDGYEMDIGDLILIEHHLVLQLKDFKDITRGLREALDGASIQSLNAWDHFQTKNSWIGGAVVKRARRPIGEAVVAFTLDEFMFLLHHWTSDHNE